jgi:hypothetical protein
MLPFCRTVEQIGAKAATTAGFIFQKLVFRLNRLRAAKTKGGADTL